MVYIIVYIYNHILYNIYIIMYIYNYVYIYTWNSLKKTHPHKLPILVAKKIWGLRDQTCLRFAAMHCTIFWRPTLKSFPLFKLDLPGYAYGKEQYGHFRPIPMFDKMFVFFWTSISTGFWQQPLGPFFTPRCVFRRWASNGRSDVWVISSPRTTIGTRVCLWIPGGWSSPIYRIYNMVT